MAFVTAEEVATRLGWPLTTDEQARVQAFIQDCTVLIEDYCGVDFEPRTDQDFTVVGYGDCLLQLPRRVLPYLIFTEVKVDGQVVTDWEVATRNSQEMSLYREAGWTGLVTITGSWGYSPLPAALKVAAAAEVIRWMARTPGLSMERTGEREVEYDSASPQTLSEAAKYALRRFRSTVGTLSLGRAD